jgi:hypothetical protein
MRPHEVWEEARLIMEGGGGEIQCASVNEGVVWMWGIAVAIIIVVVGCVMQ